MEENLFRQLAEPEKVYNIKHRAYYFSKSVIAYVQEERYEKIFFSIFDQLVRSATSIGANLVEGKAGSSKNDFLKYFNISLKSANETKYWLCLIKDTLSVDKQKVNDLLREADEISNIIAKIIVNTKANQSF